jgi:hypothetical protein
LATPAEARFASRIATENGAILTQSRLGKIPFRPEIRSTDARGQTMKLKVLSIHEQGSANKEFVWLEVVESCNLKYYGLADTTYSSDDKISDKLRHFFWFPSREVKKGERIVLRTGTGTNDQYTTTDGKKVHRFYWGL